MNANLFFLITVFTLLILLITFKDYLNFNSNNVSPISIINSIKI